VEDFRGGIEGEFYSLENLTSTKDVQEKLFDYMLYIIILERLNQRDEIDL